jgi:hypothetical protein
MTTTVIVKVNGDYRAVVHQDLQKPVNVDGPTGEKSFTTQHGKTSTFVVNEEPLPAAAGQGAAGVTQHPSASAKPTV